VKKTIDMSEDKEKVAEFLNKELELTPYVTRAYIALLLYGPLSPQGVNQKSGIPRPRTYDVLNSLIGKGLLMEQPGRPPVYAVVDAPIALEKRLMELEGKTLRQLEERRKKVESLSSSLSRLRNKNLETTTEEERVWVTRTDNAFIARYCKAIRNIRHEFVVADSSINPSRREILEAVKYVLRKNKTVRGVRPFSPQWTKKDRKTYEELITLGYQAKHSDYRGLTFAIFDQRHLVLWLLPEEGFQLAVWISLPSLSTILYEHFEELWKKGQPALQILKKRKESRTASG
jgi:sugar-specific transcriptional regulator TrmB